MGRSEGQLSLGCAFGVIRSSWGCTDESLENAHHHCLAALAFAATAYAGPSIDWDPIHLYGPASSTFNNQPLGNALSGVGTVSKFDVPFQFLDAADPTKEYTIYLYGLTSQGTATIGAPGLQFYTTNYSGGTIEIYEDLTPDSNYGTNPPNGTAPSTFTDGTLLLKGRFTFAAVAPKRDSDASGNSRGTIMREASRKARWFAGWCS